MKATITDKFMCINADVLGSYYDSKYNNEILTVTNVNVTKVRNNGGSPYFHILSTNTKTTIGHENRFSVSADQLNKKNFVRVK